MSGNQAVDEVSEMSCLPCQKSTARRLLHGLVGSTKALLQLDKADGDVILHRRMTCSVCPHALPCKGNPDEACWCGKLWTGLAGHEQTCGCNIRLKTRLNSESCPMGKW